jgi:hypothetical protein
MDLKSFSDKYFGPLSKKWCNYFYFFSVFFFVVFSFTLVIMVGTLVMNYKKVNISIVLNAVLLLLNSLIGYFVNRLLYSVCVNSLK